MATIAKSPGKEVEVTRGQTPVKVTGMQAMARFVTRPAITAPWNAGALGPKRKMRWTVSAFEELREIRRAIGGTVMNMRRYPRCDRDIRESIHRTRSDVDNLS